MLATGGFGCSPNARGQSIFAKNLYSGEENRWSRSDILGVVEENTLPDWAKGKLTKLREPAPRESVLGKIRAGKSQLDEENRAPKSHKSEPER
jgi:hypothetical protein